MTRECLAVVELGAKLANRSEPFRDHVVVVDRLEVQLPREQEICVVERVGLERSAECQPDGILDEPCVGVGLLDDVELVGPLEQTVDRGAHRAFDDLDELLRIDGLLRADVERSSTALVVCRQRNELEDPLDLPTLESGLLQALARALADEPLCAGAGVDSRGFDADDSPSDRLGRGGEPDQRDELLRGQVGHRRPSFERVLGNDLDLGAQSPLALDDLRRDVGRQLLDQQRLLDHDLLDRLLEQLGETGHVDALLSRVEVDRAVDVRGDQLLILAVADPDRFSDTADPGTRQADPHVWKRGLEIVKKMNSVVHREANRTEVTQESKFPQLVSLAAHDLRTPLATVNGFAKTLIRAETLEEPSSRYVEMIDAAAGQMAELLDELGLAARIEAGRYQPSLREANTLALALEAAATLGEDRVRVGGEGGVVRVDVEATQRAITAQAQCALRHGGVELVEVTATGPELTIAPITPASAPVVLGEDLRDLGAAVAALLVRALGGSVAVEAETLHVRLPE